MPLNGGRVGEKTKIFVKETSLVTNGHNLLLCSQL